jgi:hypothetical protein
MKRFYGRPPTAPCATTTRDPNRTAEISQRDKRPNRLQSPQISSVPGSESNHPNRQNPAESRVFLGVLMDRGEQSLLEPPQWRRGELDRYGSQQAIT